MFQDTNHANNSYENYIKKNKNCVNNCRQYSKYKHIHYNDLSYTNLKNF